MDVTLPGRAASPLAIRLFGPFEVRLGGVPLPRLRSRKGEWLLALLVLRHGRDVERAWLAGTLWPDSPEPQASSSLRSSLADLRRALGPEADRLCFPKPHSLSLDLAGSSVDVVAFDLGVALGATASLEEAVALYRGPLLEGCAEEWVHPRFARVPGSAAPANRPIYGRWRRRLPTPWQAVTRRRPSSICGWRSTRTHCAKVPSAP